MKHRSFTRAGLGIMKIFAAMVILAILSVLAFGYWVNGNMQVLESSWWSGARDGAQPIVDTTKEGAESLHRDVVKSGGWYDKAQSWFTSSEEGTDATDSGVKHFVEEHLASKGLTVGEHGLEAVPADDEETRKPEQAASATTVIQPSAPYTANPLMELSSQPLQHIEDNIVDATEHFSIALISCRQARGAKGTARHDLLGRAKSYCRSVRHLLRDTLPEYKKRDDHDSELLKYGEQLLSRAEDMLLDEL